MRPVFRFLLSLAAGLAVFSALLFSHAAGPDPRYTGAPGDNPAACTYCHVGGDPNSGPGSVVVQFPNGPVYTPGQTQTFTIQVTDPKARVYGFQMSARLNSNPSRGQAGNFTPASGEQVICDDSSLKGSGACPANAPVQFIEHNHPSGTGTWAITWTAPATDVGDVFLFVAANAGNGDGTDLGDLIYSAKYTLSPAAGNGTAPAITASGIVSASAFNPKAGFAPGSWVEIYGQNISATARSWQTSDFNSFAAPTALNGVSVTFNGTPGYVDYAGAGQVNVQVPQLPNGPAQVVVRNPDGESSAATIQIVSVAPAVLAPPSFQVNGKQYVVAFEQDGTYVGKAGFIKGISSHPASPGDTLSIYGVGFGPVNNGLGPGTLVNQINSLKTKPVFLFGQTPGELTYYGLAPNFVGLYQFNVTVPDGAGTGDVPLSVSVGGVSTNQTMYITLQ